MDAVKANSTAAVRDKDATCVLGWVELGTRSVRQIKFAVKLSKLASF